MTVVGLLPQRCIHGHQIGVECAICRRVCLPPSKDPVPGALSLVPCPWCPVPGALSLVPCPWYPVPDALSLVPCPWCPVPGALSLVPCPWCPVPGALSLVPCPWCPVPGALSWCPVLVPCPWCPVPGALSLVPCPWYPVPGALSLVPCPWPHGSLSSRRYHKKVMSFLVHWETHRQTDQGDLDTKLLHPSRRHVGYDLVHLVPSGLVDTVCSGHCGPVHPV